MKHLTLAFILALLLLPVHHHTYTSVIISDVVTLPRFATVSEEPIYEGAFEAQLTPISVASSGVILGCGDNADAHEIFMEESGCSLTAVNASSGDFGIGQSGGGLAIACPDWQTDYACQDAFFNNYALTRYGSWANALAFHLANGWW